MDLSSLKSLLEPRSGSVTDGHRFFEAKPSLYLLVEYRSDFSDVTDASRLNPLTHPRVVVPRPVAHRSVGHDGSVGQDGSVGPAVVTVNVWGLGPLTKSRVHVLHYLVMELELFLLLLLFVPLCCMRLELHSEAVF